jgi:hypothetical protein
MDNIQDTVLEVRIILRYTLKYIVGTDVGGTE